MRHRRRNFNQVSSSQFLFCSYKKLALKNHPLKNAEHMEIHLEKFHEICEAFEVLSNRKLHFGLNPCSSMEGHLWSIRRRDFEGRSKGRKWNSSWRVCVPTELLPNLRQLLFEKQPVLRHLRQQRHWSWRFSLWLSFRRSQWTQVASNANDWGDSANHSQRILQRLREDH